MGLIRCITSVQAITEAERNVRKKLPAKLAEFERLRQGLVVVADPEASDLLAFTGQAHVKDLPLLVAAVRFSCQYLLTFNVRDYRPVGASIAVQRPGDFVELVRSALSTLARGTNGGT